MKWHATGIPCNPVNNAWKSPGDQVKRTSANHLPFQLITLNESGDAELTKPPLQRIGTGSRSTISKTAITTNAVLDQG
jgi:hypothetical protein